jgi:hypothetical protein
MKSGNIQTSWFERNPKKTITGIIFVGFIGAVLLAEGGARLFLPSWAPTRAERADFWEYDSLLGWAHKKGQKGYFSHRDFNVEVSINSFRLRDKEYPIERSQKRRMLVLGDSFGWGFGVAHREIFSEIIEEKHPDWEIINASVSGYGTDQQLLYLKRRGKDLNPDVVLLLFAENDFKNNASGEQYWYYKPVFRFSDGRIVLHNHPVPRSTLAQRLDRFFYGKTYLLKRIYLKMRILQARLASASDSKRPSDGKDADRCKWKIGSSELTKEEYGYIITKRLIVELSNASKDIGARFILVSTPMDDKGRSVLEETVRRENLLYCSLDESFADIRESVTFPHDDHWNSRGHAIAAYAIGRFLQEMDILEYTDSDT